MKILDVIFEKEEQTAVILLDGQDLTIPFENIQKFIKEKDQDLYDLCTVADHCEDSNWIVKVFSWDSFFELTTQRRQVEMVIDYAKNEYSWN